MEDRAGRSVRDSTTGERPLAGRRLGEYEILRELGRGSNGVVYEALRDEDHFRVALKVLPGNLTLHQKTVARFRREAQAAAGLAHPGIVRVHDVDEVDGTHYFAMEYIEGVALDRYAQARELTIREAARLIRDAARALHFAHENGVIHRDVKPSNLLVRADGQILVSDFGLARLDKSATLTSTDAIVGTPKYMSPEQILAEKGQVDRRSDVYSLAVTLYELVTKAQPFEGDSVQSFLKNVLETEPKRPRQVNRRVPHDLETIILKGMERDPDRRYESARAIADDLDRFLGRRPIRARPPSPILRAYALVRRYRFAFTTVALALAVALAGVLLLYVRSGSRQLSYQELLETARTRLNDVQAQGPDDSRKTLHDAGEMLDRAIDIDDRREEAYVVRSRVRFYLGRYEEARSDFARAEALGATGIQLAPMRAHLALNEREWETAIEAATIGLAGNPEDADLYYIRGAARLPGADWEAIAQAEADFKECLALRPNHQDARDLKQYIADLTANREESSRLTKLREILEGFGRAGEEGASLLGGITDLIRDAAGSSSTLPTIGRSLFQQLILSSEITDEADAEEVEAALSKRIAENPGDHRLYVERGRARIRLSLIEEAIEDFEQASRVDADTSTEGIPTDWEPFFWAAFLRVTTTDDTLWDDATAQYNADYAVRLAPDDQRSRAQDVQAEVYFRMGDRDGALRIMEDLAREDPERADYYERRAAYFRG